MAHLGDFDVSAVLYGKFTTYRPSTGAAYTLGGTPALSVYKDNSTTQSTAGVTLTADFDSVTGLNHFAIDTSADGTFYSAGSFFDVVITTGTVDSVSVVGAVVASFTLRKTAALKPATAGRTLVVDASGLADANVVKVGPSGSGTAQTAGDLTAQLTAIDDYVDTEVAAIKAKTDQLTFTVANQVDVNVVDWKGSAAPAMTGDAYARLGAPANASVSADIAAVAGYVDTEVAAIKAKTDNLPASPAAVSDIPTAAAIADQVWDEILSGHAVVGSTGAALSAAGGSGDPWATALPGAYGAGTAGNIVGTYLDAAVSAVPTATENADALLNRDMSAVSATNSRSPLNALRFLRNKWSLSGTTLTVKQEDDTTDAWTATVTTSAGADPISGSDPT